MASATISTQFTQIFSQKVHNATQELKHLENLYKQHSIEKKLTQKLDEIKQLKDSFYQTISYRLQNKSKEVENIKQRFPNVIDSKLNIAQNQLRSIQKMLESNHPKLKSKKGFAQISQNKKVIDISALHVDDIFEVQSDEVSISAKVISKNKI